MKPSPVRARAWCRVDLAGGTLDIWPLGLLVDGARTVNLAIDLPVEVTLEPAAEHYTIVQSGDGKKGDLDELLGSPATALPAMIARHLGLPPVRIEIASGSPRGGGLGASSALAVALLAAGDRYLGRPLSTASQLATTARDVEARVMSLPTGVQDHYPALLGGALEIGYRVGGDTVRQLETDLAALGRSLIVAYSGDSHFSAGANWGIVRRRLDGDPEVTARLEGIGSVATRLSGALESGDLARVGSLMSEEWAERRGIAPGVSTPRLESLLEGALKEGAWGGKAAGAGGGGSIAVLGPPDRRSAIAERLAGEGCSILDVSPVAGGLEVSAAEDGGRP